MKYSLIILILVMSVLVYADYNPTNDLDKPSSAEMGSTGLQIANIFTEGEDGNYFANWTIGAIINHLTEINDNEHRWWNADGSDNSYWGAGVDVAHKLQEEIARYLKQFPACSKLLNYELESGYTATFNMYSNQTLSANDIVAEDDNSDGVPCYLSRGAGTDIIDSGTALKATIYTGRHTGYSAHELTIKTSNAQYVVYSHDPIVLDLDGDGELEASKGNYLPHSLCIPESELVPFDINADGFDELVEWVGVNDGILVHNIVNNEVSGKNLFGDATGFKNGFEQLATLDTNKDGALTGEELTGLSVWQDKNRNAKIDDGELHTLESLGITKLNVKAIELKATFERNGKYYMMWDWNPVTIMVKKTK